MTPDHIAEIALIEISRTQREAWNKMTKKLTDKMHALLEYGEFSVTSYGGQALSKLPLGATMQTVNALVTRGLLHVYRKPGTFERYYSPVSLDRARKAAERT